MHSSNDMTGPSMFYLRHVFRWITEMDIFLSSNSEDQLDIEFAGYTSEITSQVLCAVRSLLDVERFWITPQLQNSVGRTVVSNR